MKCFSLIFSKKFLGKNCVFSTLTTCGVSLFLFIAPQNVEACEFLIPDTNGNAIQGPSFETIADGFTRGLLDCGTETHSLIVMTIDVDTSQKHIGVRDDPLECATTRCFQPRSQVN